MKQAIVRAGKNYEVYLNGKLIGIVDSEDSAWELLSKTKAGG